jgi:D-aspartate ligase
MLLPDSARAAGPRDHDTPPAVLLGGTANAVSVARSLAAAGVCVVALGNAGSPVRRSRSCALFVDLGREDGVQDRWLDWLAEGPGGAVVLPCDDDGLELVATHRRRLTALGYLPIEADDRVALEMLDKNRTYELARRIGIPAPRTVTVRTAADVDAVADGLAYPCALKPVHSHRFQRRTGTGIKAYVVKDAAELRDRFAYTREMGVEMLVTEIIPGPDDQIFGYHSYLDERGEPLFGVTKRKLRQHPVGFGLGSYHETTNDAEVARLGDAFLRGVGVRGLANVEFKRDARDGVLKLIECNHRFTAPNEQIRIAGVDLALIAYNRVLGLPLPPVDGYRAGVRLWHPGADARAFLALRRRGELSLAQWVRSVARTQHFPLFRWADPRPSLGLHAVRARRVVGKRLARRGAAAAGAPVADPAAHLASARTARPASHGGGVGAAARVVPGGTALHVAASRHDGR